MRADFHIHSTASDGKFTPSQIVRHCASIGLKALSITDHDTVGDLSEALAEARSLPGLYFVAGIELSAELAGASVHILGYHIDPNSPVLEEFLLKQRVSRQERARRILDRLAKLGIEVRWEVLAEIAGGSPIGRPHIAQALVKEGYVSSVKEAFSRYLDWGAPAYIPRRKASAGEVIRVIEQSGGIAVLAHPLDLERKGLDVWQTASYLCGLGLRGIEVYYNGYDRKQCLRLVQIARRLNLFILGGSDFHGLNPSETPIGKSEIPDDEIEPFLKAAQLKVLLSQI